MIYLHLHDRLGNLLFMIAAALSTGEEVSVFADTIKEEKYIRNMIDILKLPMQYAAPPRNINQLSVFEYFYPTIYKPIECQSDCIVDGYFQSYRYFNCHDVIQWFKCPEDIKQAILSKYGALLIEKEVVNVHVRRGDYLMYPERFPFVGVSYLRKAMRKFESQKTVFLFTSDDIAWCKANFKGENIYYSENESEYFDLFLASMCSHNILSNSTFSWWGAYLNQNKDKRVIYPERWYGPVLFKEIDASKGELIPSEWSAVKCKWDNMKSATIAYYKYFRCNWRNLLCLRF